MLMMIVQFFMGDGREENSVEDCYNINLGTQDSDAPLPRRVESEKGRRREREMNDRVTRR